MPKAIAIAVRRNAVASAFSSAKNFGQLLLDFMYGTPERARITMVFALGLAALGAVFSIGDSNASVVCPIL